MFRFFKSILNKVLPHCCLLCYGLTDTRHDLCRACWNDLPHLTMHCLRCANSLLSTTQMLCGECLQHPPPFDYTHALFYYQPPITQLILQLKFQHQLAHAQLLGELLADKIREQWYQAKPLPQAILPIPLHTSRLKERGFNQAIEIARPIAKHTRLPLLLNHCLRIKATAPQTTLAAKERQHNLQQAFAMKNLLPYDHLAVVDDVMTTGSTMMEFCRMLKKHGVKTIDVWCCARPHENRVK